jgi:hypothetical protein
MSFWGKGMLWSPLLLGEVGWMRGTDACPLSGFSSLRAVGPLNALGVLMVRFIWIVNFYMDSQPLSYVGQRRREPKRQPLPCVKQRLRWPLQLMETRLCRPLGSPWELQRALKANW